MHPLAERHFATVLQSYELAGPNEGCKYYPCHSIVEDCTWCYCPFYPCEDESLGEYVISKRTGKQVWSCKRCTWIHRKRVAEQVLETLRGLGVRSPEDIERLHERLLRIKEREWPPEAR
ncbi:MAG: cysteine-rich small domain-containing protein [Armatimonadota bacterium]|nr:cysteine-rich small domain-containing protein [Armatimonadota bacterium]